MTFVLLLAGCPRSIAPEVASTPAAEPAEPSDPAERLAWMVRGDPLVRRPRLPAAPDEPALAAVVEVVGKADARPDELWALERAHPASLAVPFARGARLAALETSLTDPAAALDWFLPMPRGRTSEQRREPLDWFGAPGEALLPVAERSVLLGWLDGPGVPDPGLAAVLGAPQWGRLADTPAGRLLVARGSRVEGTGRSILEESTRLALLDAAANTDRQQEALRIELGPEGRGKIDALLREAESALRANAGEPRDLGGALLAQAALRWRDACPDKPCGGMDRIGAMRAAGRWAPEVDALARAWLAIAWKNTDDQLVASWGHPSVTRAGDKLVELALGDGAGLERSVLGRSELDAAWLLALNRAIGGGDLTGKEDLFRSVHRRVAVLAADAERTAPEALREPLRRIGRGGV